MCVDAGVRAASDLGYSCVVVHDACATRDQEFAGKLVPAADVHAAFMAALQFGYARLVSTANTSPPQSALESEPAIRQVAAATARRSSSHSPAGSRPVQ